MLIRIKGGSGGIKNYLETGQKQDRFYSRDELDNRIILSGDLEIVENLIEEMNNYEVKRDKYVHITLSFKEDIIDEKILNEISNEFRNFYLKAYDEDEVHFYAEAHLPKIKSYINAKTGESIIRKPHIHIVIPTINILTGNAVIYYEPNNIKYMEAFQEYINNKYGLESPKNNPRYKINENSEFISRYKGDGFKGKHRDIRENFFFDIISKNISSFSEFKIYLEDKGYIIKIRNQGKGQDKEYFNILDDKGTSINLRDKVFQEKFLKLRQDDKLKKIKTEIMYIESNTRNTKLEINYETLLQEWHELKAYEYKYLNANSNKQNRELFYQLPKSDKIEYIKTKQMEFQKKYYGVKKDGTYTDTREYREYGSINIEQTYLDTIAQNIRTADNTLEIIRDNLGRSLNNKASPIGGDWRRRIATRYARIIRRSENYFRRDTSEYIPNESGSGSNIKKIGRYNTVDIEYKNFLSKLELTRPEFIKLINKFNLEIQGNVLLELLEKTHGVIPELYRITVAPDGSDRIGCGSRNLSMMDFCIKEMNFTLEETNNILSNAFNMQMDVNRERGWSRNNSVYLSQEYKEWFKDYKLKCIENRLKNKEIFQLKRKEIIEKYVKNMAIIRANNRLLYRVKREQINILKINKLLEIDALNKLKIEAKINQKNQYNLEMQKAYRIFLCERALKNDEKALMELRRLRINFDEVQKFNSINYVDRYNEYKLDITYIIDERGVINYQYNGKTIIQDHGKRVSIIKQSDENIKLILGLAIQKFGLNINLTGSERFKQKAVELAIKNNMQINFIDEFSKNYYQRKIEELKTISNQLNNDKLKIINDKPEILYVNNVNYIEIINKNNRFEKINVIQLINPVNKKSYNVSGYNINFFAKSVVKNQFIEFNQDINGDLVLKNSSIENEIRKLKNVELEKSKLDFHNQIKTAYDIKDLKHDYSGKLIKTSEIYGKFYVLISTENGIKKIYNNDLKIKLKDLNIKSGDYISIAIPKTKRVEVSKEEKVITIKKSNKIFDDLLLDIDVHTDRSKYKSEYFGRVLNIKRIKLKTGRETNLATINDILTNKQQTLYIDNLTNLKENDFTYLGEKSFNNYEAINLNDKLKSNQKKILQQNEMKEAIIGDISKIGIRNIKNKDVYFVEFRTDSGIITKYGDKIRQEIEKSNLIIGDGILLTEEYNILINFKEENIIEIKQISKDINKIVENKIERFLREIEDKRLQYNDLEI
jgi:hypothetical protein